MDKFNFSAAATIIRGGLNALFAGPFLSINPAWISQPLHSPGGRVPLRFTLNQDVISRIHDMVLH